MLNHEEVQSTLDTLQGGITEGHTITGSTKTLIEYWDTTIGRTVSGPEVLGSDSVLLATNVSTIRLRGMGKLPVLLLTGDSTETSRALKALSLRMTGDGAIGIIVCLNAAALTAVRISNATPTGRCVILSASAILDLLTDERPRDVLLQRLLEQISRDRLNPFGTCAPTEGITFVGRTGLLRTLVDSSQDYALCGSGGIGKTSLLRQMQWILRRRRDPRYERLVEVDLISRPSSLDAVCQEIAKRISPTKDAHNTCLADFETCLRRLKSGDLRFHGGPIDLVIDEMDRTLELDRAKRDADGKPYQLMRALCYARHVGLIRLTLSGREGTREMLDDPENPFVVDSEGPSRRGRIKLMPLQPLTSGESELLLLGPLRDLGFPVEEQRHALLQRLRECNGIPFNIHELGLELVEALPEPQGTPEFELAGRQELDIYS